MHAFRFRACKACVIFIFNKESNARNIRYVLTAGVITSSWGSCCPFGPSSWTLFRLNQISFIFPRWINIVFSSYREFLTINRSIVSSRWVRSSTALSSSCTACMATFACFSTASTEFKLFLKKWYYIDRTCKGIHKQPKHMFCCDSEFRRDLKK